MTRIIKFRAWNPIENKLEYWTLNDLCYHQPRDRPDICLESWQEWTGLLDKNGKEIYEGDIVKYTFRQTVPVNGKFNASVFFHQGGFAIGTVNNEPLTLREAIKVSNKADDLEIIGNVWENNDLLKNE